MKNRTYYAYRFGFGHEGHGASIYIAEGPSEQAVEERAKKILQEQFGGLWLGKFFDTSIGSKTQLRSKGFDL